MNTAQMFGEGLTEIAKGLAEKKAIHARITSMAQDCVDKGQKLQHIAISPDLGEKMRREVSLSNGMIVIDNGLQANSIVVFCEVN